MTPRLAEEARAFALALAFLTRIPLPSIDASPRRLEAMLRYLPVVGALVGVVGAAVLLLAGTRFSPMVGALLAVGATALLTGAFHEDGLADSFDGIGGGADVERVLAIMRDSRLGTYGMLGVGLVVALKVASLATMPLAVAATALVAAHAASRLSALVLVATSRYLAAAGTGSFTARGIGSGSLAVATATVAAVLAAVSPFIGPGCLAAGAGGLILGHLAARFLFVRRLGGYTGDGLGATQQLSELGFYLGVAAWF
jgi:adenosylcobinamide-GDP ribazoletransferase